MAFSADLAARIRADLADTPGLSEKKMFGGVAFMVHGNMCCGVLQDELIVRVGPAQHAAALSEPHTRAFQFSGPPMRGMVMVAPAGWSVDADLADWLSRGLAFARSLPPK